MEDALETALGRVGERLRKLAATGGAEVAIAAGEAVLDEVYGDDPDGWRSGRKVSLRRLAAASSLSPSTLYRFVAVAAMMRALGNPRFEHLGLSHLRQVLALPTDEQRDLLAQAEAGRWTVARLVKAVANRLPERPRARRSGGFRTAFAFLERWDAQRDRFQGLDELGALSTDDHARFLRIVHTLQGDLELVESRLRTARRSKRVA